ncbi:MAG: sterol carrier protein domain-containing protein [Knoellia sp.]
MRVVDDPGHADGTFAIDTAQGRAEARATSESPALTLDVETLGTLYLGDVTVDTLARAGRITGTEAALRRFGAMADGSPSPHCNTQF